MTQFDDWSVLASCLVVFAGDCGSGFMRINDYTPCGKRTVCLFAVGAGPENELGGGQFRGCPPAGSRKADDFSQLKGYLDVTSGILGAYGPLAPPLKSASGLQCRSGRVDSASECGVRGPKFESHRG